MIDKYLKSSKTIVTR